MVLSLPHPREKRILAEKTNDWQIGKDIASKRIQVKSWHQKQRIFFTKDFNFYAMRLAHSNIQIKTKVYNPSYRIVAQTILDKIRAEHQNHYRQFVSSFQPLLLVMRHFLEQTKSPKDIYK
jgi:hypothetical protein